jgi:hypothetical protein
MNKLIYVASPYNHSDDDIRWLNYRKVSRYSAGLIAKGQVVISPIAYGHPLLDFAEIPYDWPFWSNFCLTFLDRCDEMHVLMMEGWDKSRGVEEEIQYARQQSIPIKYIEKDLDYCK